MKSRYLIGSNAHLPECNIFADKSSLVLDWLLKSGFFKESFSIREVAKDTGVSLGLVQRVFNILFLKGFLKTEGVRTAKKFFFNKPKDLLESWKESYNIVKKCKIRTYSSALSGKSEWLKAIKDAGLSCEVVLALHSAADALGYKNTNLQTLELYIVDPLKIQKIEKALQLEPQERGYEVLLIEPYYKNLIKKNIKDDPEISFTPLFLTLLDLYHFPLRGEEQAEFIMQRSQEIKQLYKKH